eukprot:1157027-Pelagomonas_calceolata.AAC.7
MPSNLSNGCLQVSDAAAGGQILMEGSTFSAIKDVLGELGTVDAQVDALEPNHRKAGQSCGAGKSRERVNPDR